MLLMPVARIFLILSVLFCFPAFTQEVTRIKLVRANDLKFEKKFNDKIQRLLGDVVLQHDETLLMCDSAWLNSEENFFNGFGHVHIQSGDTLNIYSDKLDYNGNTKIAELHDNVRLTDRKTTLITGHLIYDRGMKVAYYPAGGTLKDEKNTLTSSKGYYYTGTKKANFRKDVKLRNKRYTMFSDTLIYETKVKTALFYGPTVIKSDSNYIYCEEGWYNTENEKSAFFKNPFMVSRETRLDADSIYYERNARYGKALHNIHLADTVNKFIIQGDFAELFELQDYAYVTRKPTASLYDDTDTLYLSSDTIRMVLDSTGKGKALLAYYHTRFFRDNIQGICDSLTYNVADSAIRLDVEPVIWSDDNQLTGDTIHILFKNKKISQFRIPGSGFIVSMDDSSAFNQIKGKTINGYFRDNELNRLSVNGNAESIYFVREDDGSLIGINKAVASDLSILVKDKKIKHITFIQQPVATLYPESQLPVTDRVLKGFRWMPEKRPKDKNDILEGKE